MFVDDGGEAGLAVFLFDRLQLAGYQLFDPPGARLGMDQDESVVRMVLPGDYSGALLFFFENGKAARVDLSAYATTSNRRKLTGAYSDKSPLSALLHLTNITSALFVVSKDWLGPSSSLYFCTSAIRRDWGVIFLKYPWRDRNTVTGEARRRTRPTWCPT